ncbi:DUF4041 domain-containing protein [Streptomyces sp. ST2-7A]|uniref:DUF4041 domain-containing protein n=1 Tax=Streptomyces sp. ST2-7A TaxID=2907214 RepID=UPI001F23168A|nr:DUF4041 domain-containing protein [Streptomyces sp. ST2-7A]MCE7079867.1 DUF4041 domain-containing protein [Streptomyces sp. ST2-7A]
MPAHVPDNRWGGGGDISPPPPPSHTIPGDRAGANGDHGAGTVVAAAQGLLGRRRRQAEAEAGRLAEELRRARTENIRQATEITALKAQLSRAQGPGITDLVAETTRLRAERDAVEAEAAARAERAEAELREALSGEQRRFEELSRLVRETEAQSTHARHRLEELRLTVVRTEEEAMLQEAGIYEYRHPLADAVAYKSELATVRDRAKDLAKREGGAVLAATDWQVNGSVTAGRKMVRDFSKLLLRAYNAEADNAVRGMRPHRLESMVDRLEKSRQTIARLGTTMHIRISDPYHLLRVRELELTADYLAKQEEEREQRRELRERQREEERLQKELERERARLEKERRHWASALERLLASGSEDPAAVEELRAKLAEVEESTAAVNAREANARAGYVYVISNIGAFGGDIVKIGMTRRLEPMDRVNELGDASVPFKFDVHALIFSEDAMGLERRLHEEFEDRRVNRVNPRREFFRVRPTEVREALKRVAGQHLLEFREDVEAPEWRASGTGTTVSHP